jgi:hypothetical protein
MSIQAGQIRKDCRALEEIIVAILLLFMVFLTASDIVKTGLKSHGLWPPPAKDGGHEYEKPIPAMSGLLFPSLCPRKSRGGDFA